VEIAIIAARGVDGKPRDGREDEIKALKGQLRQ
jgi:hypothetical protein